MDQNQMIDEFIKSQRNGAKGMRREMLEKNLYGTRILLANILLPVFKTLEGIVLEYEILSQNGVVPHVEKMTRERHDFEQARLRSFAARRYTYIPFSRDEIENRPEACRRSLYEIIGELNFGSSGNKLLQLDVNERELLRFALRNPASFNMAVACDCLGVSRNTARKNLRSLQSKGLMTATGAGTQRSHYYRITEEGRRCFH